MKPFTIGLLVWISMAVYAVNPSGNPDSLVTTGGSVFVRRTLYPGTEKDELVISRNGEVVPIYTLYTADGSSVEYLFSSGDNTGGYDCFEVYNAAADGSSFLFYKRPENHLYSTYGIYAEFDSAPESVDFVKKEVLLKNRHSTQVPGDTLDLENQTDYFICTGNIIRVGLKEVRIPPIALD
ncbi:MAG: hypothetical protein LIP01_07450 [Tannerellaceae bacterium]|nr:hypothetical protein [Tannerellaceae bacterium]